MENKTEDKKGLRVTFAAIDPYIEQYIPLPVEKEDRGKKMVQWGSDNAYPDYLLELYRNVPTLRSIINGNIDFITGDDIIIDPLHEGFEAGRMNERGDTIREQVRDLAKDYELYGGFALQVIRGTDGSVAEVHYLDIRHLRSNKENDVFYYCEDWKKRGAKETVVYPVFLPDLQERWPSLTDEERNRNASSVLFVKTVRTQVYPAPLYAAAVRSCEIERCIDEFHLSSINNGFVTSAIINFNNGQPKQEQQEEIERNFNEKFSGYQNAARIAFSWNKNKDSATTIEVPKVDDFGNRYNTLAERSRQQIFCSFRAIPALFGLMTESTGFNSQEFEQSFKVYARTQIRPVQRLIVETYERIYGRTGIMTIKPFTLDGGETVIE